MHSGAGDVALLQLVRFSGDAEPSRQLSEAAPFMLTQVLSVPLCMMQAGTGDLLHSRLERERAKGRRSPGTACVAGRGASGATSTDALCEEGGAPSGGSRAARCPPRRDASQPPSADLCTTPEPVVSRVPRIPAYSWRDLRPEGCDAAPWRHEVYLSRTLNWQGGGPLASSKS